MQRKKIYDWEARLPDGGPLSLAQCQAFVDHVAAASGIEAPRVSDGRGRRSAAYTSSHEIRIPVRYRTRRTLLHEMAHALAEAEVVEREPAHGPTFALIYLELLSTHLDLDLSALRESAREAGIRIEDADSAV
jgi:hypothetical protein